MTVTEQCQHADTEQCSWCRPDRTFTRPAVRIDTLRNRIEACRELLAMARIELEDLHVLAYERAAAAALERVDGGSRDYALDTHGSKRARDAYRLLGDAVCEIVEVLSVPAHQARRILRDGDDRHPQPRAIQLVDLAAQLDTQRRRIALGDSYQPVRAVAQPDKDTAHDEATKETERLKRENKRLERFGKWAWEQRAQLLDLLPKDAKKKHKRDVPQDFAPVLAALFPPKADTK